MIAYLALCKFFKIFFLQITWADLAVMNSWHWIPGFGVNPPLDNYPKLKAHKERLEANPRVADWIERRPDTPV